MKKAWHVRTAVGSQRAGAASLVSEGTSTPIQEGEMSTVDSKATIVL